MDADTLHLIREENLPNLQPFDDEGCFKVDKALYGYQSSPRYWKDAVAEAAKDLGLKPSKIDNFFEHGPRKLHPAPETSFSTCTWKANFSLETISLCVTWYES